MKDRYLLQVVETLVVKTLVVKTLVVKTLVGYEGSLPLAGSRDTSSKDTSSKDTSGL